jgi:hypothetical protein
MFKSSSQSYGYAMGFTHEGDEKNDHDGIYNATKFGRFQPPSGGMGMVDDWVYH